MPSVDDLAAALRFLMDLDNQGTDACYSAYREHLDVEEPKYNVEDGNAQLLRYALRCVNIALPADESVPMSWDMVLVCEMHAADRASNLGIDLVAAPLPHPSVRVYGRSVVMSQDRTRFASLLLAAAARKAA